jgi:hypothetical protein
MAGLATLYFWANPLTGFRGADHTWVTTYPSPSACPPPSDYWYCWGVCHPTGTGTTARALGSSAGDLAIAKCICSPNNQNAHGGINLYGIDGVCHQLANRVLYACNPVQTVHRANLYWISHLLFGTYGLTLADWAQRKQKCAQPPSPPGSGGGSGTLDDVDGEDLDLGTLTNLLATKASPGEVVRLSELRANLLREKRELDEQVQAGAIDGLEFANRVNDLVSSYLPRIAAIIGEKNLQEIFGASSGDQIQLLDPQQAARTEYSRKPEYSR